MAINLSAKKASSKSPKVCPAIACILVNLQFALMSRKGFRVMGRRSRGQVRIGAPPDDAFVERLLDNIRAMGLGEGTESGLLASAIAAAGSPPAKREELCLEAIDKLGSVIKAKLAKKGKAP